MRVGVLGPIEVAAPGGSPAPIGSRTQRLIVALLASHPAGMSVDSLVDSVWGDEVPKAAVSSLRAQISRLRKARGDVVVATDDGYRLSVDHDEIDAARFDRLLRQAAAAEPADARDLLGSALALWRGPAFGDLADEPALTDEARRLESARVDARERLAEAHLAFGRSADAAGEAEALVAVDPYRERAWAVLVRALCAGGRNADALRAYQRAVDALGEIGLEPGPDLRAAEQEAFGDAPAAGERDDRPTSPSRPPLPPTELLGRTAELDRARALLDQARVVTLLGPGGVGKTRLALSVAEERAHRHRLGARLVELAAVAVGDDAAVAEAVAQVLGLAGADALGGAGDLDVLVLLDNCEHVIAGAAVVAAQLVGRGEQLRIVATSRERLEVDGEHVLDLVPLGTATPDAPAVDLFEARARAAGYTGGFDRALAARIAERLDGLPLAIEMAAARLQSMTLDELAAAVEHDVGDLRQRRRDADDRHRTLHAVLEWSEQLLGHDQRRALADLSVFVGPVGRREVTAVLADADAVATADELVARSLLAVDRVGGHSAYRMLDTIRDHGRGRLVEAGRADEVRARHARWYAEQLSAIDATLRGPDEATGHATFALVFDEVRAAHRWARHHELDLAAAMAEDAHVAAIAGLRGEMSGWLDELAAAAEPGSATARRALAALAGRLATAGRLDDARRHATTVLDAADDDRPAMLALEALSDAALFAGDLDASVAAGQRLYEVAAERNDAYFHVTARVNEALALAYGGEVDAGLEWVEGADGRFPSADAWLAYARGEVILDRDVDLALRELDEAVRVAVEVGNRFLAGVALVSASSLRARAGDPSEAARAFVDLLDHYADTGDRSQQLTTLKNLVVLLTRIGEPTAAVELAAVVLDDPTSPTYGDEAERLAVAIATAEDELGRAGAAGARDAAVGRGIDEAAAVARAVLADG